MANIITASYSDELTHLHFSASAGTLTVTGTTPSGGNMSWVSVSPVDPALFIGTNELEEGEVRAFRLKQVGEKVELEPLGSVQKTEGHSPAHHLVVEEGGVVLAANYMTGTLLAVPLTATGLKAPTHPILKFPFIGPGPNLERQESSHPHQVYQRSSSEILIPDLGADKIWRLAPSASGEWEIKGEVACASGAGPRHVQLVASDLYVLNELNNTLSHYTLPGGLGTTASVRTTQPCTLLPTPPGAGAAELLLHPAGKYLYATNRDSGDAKGDTIAIFKLEASVLALGAKEPKWVKEVHTGLEHIRGAVIKELDGKVWLIAAGVKGGGIKVFEVVGGENLVEVAHAAIEKVTGFAWL